MSYIGSNPTSQSFAPGTDTFNGDGTTVAFTLSRNVATVNDIQVVVNNVVQQPSAYTVSVSTLTFSAAPSSGTNNIYVRYLSTNLQTIAPQQGSVYPSSLSTGGPYWNTSGNVGVGTTTPAQKLDVAGPIKSSGYFLGSTGTSGFAALGTTGTATDGGNFVGRSTTSTYNTGGIELYTGGSERMRIDSSGNLVVGGTTATGLVSSTKNTAGSYSAAFGARALGTAQGQLAGYMFLPTFTGTADNIPRRAADIWAGFNGNWTGEYLSFGVGTGASNDAGNQTTERMRLDGSGNLSVGGTSYSDQISSQSGVAAKWTISANATVASGAAYGYICRIANQSPNNTTSIFAYYTDSTLPRCIIYSNGGIQNYQANNSNLSDQREKTNFAPAGNYLSKICAIPVQTFNYIDQNLEEDDGLTLGVIAQDVQAVAPELVTESNWGTEEEPRMRLSIYQTDLQYALMKCIQEQQAMIEELKTKVAALEAR